MMTVSMPNIGKQKEGRRSEAQPNNGVSRGEVLLFRYLKEHSLG